MRDGDDVQIIRPDAIRDDVRKAADFELAGGESAAPWGTDLGMGFNQRKRTSHGIEQPTAPSWAAYFMPAHRFSKF